MDSFLALNQAEKQAQIEIAFDEILNLIESVSEGFPSYSYYTSHEMVRKRSIEAMSFRLNPFHAIYILSVYNMSYMYLNKILFKPR